MSKVSKVKVVYANWCPHCVPTTVEPMKEVAREIGAELELLDIDVAGERADEVVREHGDWCVCGPFRAAAMALWAGLLAHSLALASLRKACFSSSR